MNRIKPFLNRKTEADLKVLVEPLAAYISAVSNPREVLFASLFLLLDELREIDETASAQLATFSENFVG